MSLARSSCRCWRARFSGTRCNEATPRRRTLLLLVVSVIVVVVVVGGGGGGGVVVVVVAFEGLGEASRNVQTYSFSVNSG